jgi:TolB-like protein
VIAFLLIRERRQGDAQAEAVAVLPFLTASADPQDERLSDGFVDELTTALAKVHGLRVVARSSAFQFQGKKHDVADVGRKLHVGSIVEGSVRRVGNRLRITVQLIRAADASHFWAETYEREGADLFSVQAEIVRGVTAALQMTPTPAQAGSRMQRSPLPAAYDLYLRGRAFRNEATPEGLAKSVALLRQIETTQMRSGTPNVEMAFIHAGLGNRDRAFACLEQAFAEREGELLFLNVSPIFDSLRSDGRFSALVRRIGLP